MTIFENLVEKDKAESYDQEELKNFIKLKRKGAFK